MIFLYILGLVVKCGDSIKGNGVQDGFVELGCLDFGTGRPLTMRFVALIQYVN